MMLELFDTRFEHKTKQTQTKIIEMNCEMETEIFSERRPLQTLTLKRRGNIATATWTQNHVNGSHTLTMPPATNHRN